MSILSMLGKIIDKSQEWVKLIGGVLGIVLAIGAVWNLTKSSKHELSIHVPQTTIDDSNIRFAMAFHNTGDYNEVITNIDCYFVENLGQAAKENNVKIAEYSNMILIDSKKSMKSIIEGKIDIDSSPFDLLLSNGATYVIVLRLEIVSEKDGFVSEAIPVGSIHIVQDQKTQRRSGDVRLVSNYRQVDFTHPKPVLTITNFPRTTEYDLVQLKERI
jgi:hypothetical protein